MALPQLTPEQRQEALAKARMARRERSERLAALKGGNITLDDLLREAKANPDGAVAKTKLEQVIRNLPGFGPKTAAAMLSEAEIDGGKKRLKGLTERQTKVLVELREAYRTRR